MNGRNPSKLLFAAAVLLMAVLMIACAVLRQGLVLAAFSDIVSALLMLSALLTFAWHGMASKGRMRWFWLLQSAGWALWLSDQMVWVTFDLVLKRKMPAMHPADSL
ncbi:MAG: hypothetical protein ABSF93_21580, partial [Candidatus Sulfotelmatobacter sp.]